MRTGSWTGPPRGERAPRVEISSTVFGVRACGTASDLADVAMKHPFVSLLHLQRHSKPAANKVDVRLPGKGDSNSHGARPVHLIITMMKWIRTSRLSIKNSLSLSIFNLGRPDGSAFVVKFTTEELDRLRVAWLKRRGRSHKTRRCRGVAYPESYITKYTTYTKITSVSWCFLVPFLNICTRKTF